MTGHYKCAACGEIFDEPDTAIDSEPYEFWGQRGVRIIEYDICPYCHAEEVDEVWLCDICDEREPTEGSDLCEDCQEEDDGGDSERGEGSTSQDNDPGKSGTPTTPAGTGREDRGAGGYPSGL